MNNIKNDNLFTYKEMSVIYISALLLSTIYNILESTHIIEIFLALTIFGIFVLLRKKIVNLLVKYCNVFILYIRRKKEKKNNEKIK